MLKKKKYYDFISKLKNNESNNQNRQFAFFDIKISQTIQFIDLFESLKTNKNESTRFRWINEIIVKRFERFKTSQKKF